MKSRQFDIKLFILVLNIKLMNKFDVNDNVPIFYMHCCKTFFNKSYYGKYRYFKI